jgi:hypothetical protein
MESFLGSVWFGIMLAALGYICGNLLPFATVAKWIPTKKD